MAYDKQKVLTIAENEVGYLEKASNSQLDSKTANAGHNNYTKYARDLANVSFFNGRKQGAAWCAVFVAWCFYKAYGKDAALSLLCQPTKAANNAGAGCKYARQYFSQKGRLHSTPQPGDVIFFYSSDKSQIQHQGIVYKVDASRVYTIEGNTSGASGVIGNGGGVCKKSYALNYSRLAGFGRPNWDAEEKEKTKNEEQESVKKPAATTATYITYTVKKGDSLWKIASKLLGNGNKYKQIQSANNINGTLIRVGQKLKIPKG
jgi:LysM repeat protein